MREPPALREATSRARRVSPLPRLRVYPVHRKKPPRVIRHGVNRPSRRTRSRVRSQSAAATRARTPDATPPPCPAGAPLCTQRRIRRCPTERARKVQRRRIPASLDAEDVVEHRAHERVVEEPRRGPGAVAGVERGARTRKENLWAASRFSRNRRPRCRRPDPLRPLHPVRPSSAPAARSAGSPPATRTARPGASTPRAINPRPTAAFTWNASPALADPTMSCVPPSSLPPRCSGTCDRRPSRRTPSRPPVRWARRSGTESACRRAPRRPRSPGELVR